VALVYNVQPSPSSDVSGVAGADAFETDQMDRLLAVVSRRINPSGVLEVSIRAVGPRQVEIIIPTIRPAEVERFERILHRAGMREFRILANSRDHKDAIERALADPSTTRIFDSKHNLLAWWVPVKQGEDRSFLMGYSDITRRARGHGDREILEVLIVPDIYNVTRAYLTRVKAATDIGYRGKNRWNSDSDNGSEQ
jgi:hypothetical protein